MRGLLFFLVLVAIIVVALGFYQGWWSFSTSSDSETGQKSGKITIDEKKMKDDVQKAKDKIKSSVDKHEQPEVK
jgi:hypothetical protein